MDSTFVKIGLLPTENTVLGDKPVQMEPRVFIEQKLIPTLKAFFSIAQK
jgi:hypothetical protein